MSINEKLIACFVAIVIPSYGVSQNKLFPYVQIGLSASQFPTKNTTVTWQISDSTVTKANPIIGPVIGISTKFNLTKCLKIDFGLSYQFSGTKTYSYSQSTAPNIYPVSYFKDWLDIKTHKFCIPIDFGFEFKFKNIKPLIFVGTKPNLIITTKMHEKGFHSDWTEPIITNTNLFSKKIDYQPPKRIINQLSFGLSIPIGKCLKVNLSYNLGHNYYQNTYWVRGNYSRVPYEVKTFIKSSDYLFCIQYDLCKQKKEKSSP